MFKLPNRRINKVRITLTPMDTYQVEFLKLNLKTLECQVVDQWDNVYADQLQQVFTNATGLDTHL
jgi:hypothetical protein